MNAFNEHRTRQLTGMERGSWKVRSIARGSVDQGARVSMTSQRMARWRRRTAKTRVVGLENVEIRPRLAARCGWVLADHLTRLGVIYPLSYTRDWYLHNVCEQLYVFCSFLSGARLEVPYSSIYITVLVT